MKGGWVVRAALLLAVATGVDASERSELLVAQGQAAYRAGRLADAEDRFAAAVAADAQDAGAHYGLGLTLAKRGRFGDAQRPLEQAIALRPDFPEARRALTLVASRQAAAAGPEEKRWEVRGTAGFQYDSNPALEPDGVHDHRDQATFVLGAHGQYDVVRRPNASVRLEYGLYQTIMPDFDDFNFRSNQLAATGSWGIRPWVWAGVQGGYNHYALGSSSYLQEPFAMPFVTFAQGNRGRTQLLYRHGESDYLDSPFDDDLERDGPTDATGVTQTFLFGGGRFLNVGYQFEREDPRHASGAEFERNSNQALVGVGFPAWWSTAVELNYLYRNDDYPTPSRDIEPGVHRDDDAHYFAAGVRRNLTDHLNVALVYRGTVNESNVEVFDYRRNMTALLFELTY